MGKRRMKSGPHTPQSLIQRRRSLVLIPHSSYSARPWPNKIHKVANAPWLAEKQSQTTCSGCKRTPHGQPISTHPPSRTTHRPPAHARGLPPAWVQRRTPRHRSVAPRQPRIGHDTTTGTHDLIKIAAGNPHASCEPNYSQIICLSYILDCSV